LIIDIDNKFLFIYQGVLSARGQWILFADADGATQFNGFTKVEKSALAAMKVNKNKKYFL
jgi:hypothetical protein